MPDNKLTLSPKYRFLTTYGSQAFARSYVWKA